MGVKGHAATLGFAGILAGSLIVALDAVALSPSLPTIEEDLNTTTLEAYWAGVAYTLGSATFLPLFPAASNIFGRRGVSLAALLLFLVGTIVCSTAQNIAALLAGRVLQGIGGGGIIGMMYVVITDLFEKIHQPKALAVNGLIWLLGTSLGPIMGGGFSGNISWRWIFWIALPINAIALVLVGGFLKIPMPNLAESATPVKRLNWTLLSRDDCFLIPMTWGGVMYAWDSYHTLVPLILGAAGCVAWLVYEFVVPSNPILPLVILNDRTVAISLFSAFALGLIQFGLIFYLPLYYQIVKGYSSLISGVALLPETLLAGPTTVLTGMIMSRIGKYKAIIIVGWIMTALGCGLLVLLDEDMSIAAWIFINVPAGLGIGILFPSTPMAAQAPVKEEHGAIASGLVASTRTIGQAIGIAAGNAIVQNGLRRELNKASSAILRQDAALISANSASPQLLSLIMRTGPTERTELLDAYVKSIHGVWWLLFAMASFCGILTLFIRDVGLGKTKAAVEKHISSTSSLPLSCDDEELRASWCEGQSPHLEYQS
ncbi:MFS transporter L2 [Fulvia fulva]|uniref:MFS transporter L2 n=1 Tax=Passalora fulva TaxID=5499 RepID=A0A9Q8PEW2_PASFU|nr:MFS transporter L2 [Fulvia fulva]KAK4618629.1 MFS transporter L2 [Fulvia fulva]UJO21151.1 MFS transporter L2 [Fulvia fulva]